MALLDERARDADWAADAGLLGNIGASSSLIHAFNIYHDMLPGDGQDIPREEAETLQLHQRGGLYRKLGMLAYIKRHNRSEGRIPSGCDELIRRRKVKSDIVDKFREMRPHYATIAEAYDVPTEEYRAVLKVRLRTGIQFLLKIAEFPKSRSELRNDLLTDYYIGHILGGMTPFVCQTFDIRELEIPGNRTRIEVLMEDYGPSLLVPQCEIDQHHTLMVAAQLG
jgi:hypothetical protein